jgi:hypothetical protein
MDITKEIIASRLTAEMDEHLETLHKALKENNLEQAMECKETLTTIHETLTYIGYWDEEIKAKDKEIVQTS